MRRDRRPLRLERRQERRLPGGAAMSGDKLRGIGGSLQGILGGAPLFLPQELGVPFSLPACKSVPGLAASEGKKKKRGEIREKNALRLRFPLGISWVCGVFLRVSERLKRI